jgi:hypothetical protein
MKTVWNKSFVIVLCLLCIARTTAYGQPNREVKKVHVIFKTHLDVGFTDLSSKVEERYIREFIPGAIEVAEQLRAGGGEERYVWTTGSWIIAAYLAQAAPEMREKLEAAIRRGDIAWNGVPYTFDSETMTGDFFATALRLSQKLDARFGKKTIAAKMTDVPGHTRSMVSPLCDAGIRLLHVGVNSASTVPEVPPACRWRNTDGKEIILMYQGSYGEDMVLPGGETVMAIRFTGDNLGPHTVEQVKAIYARLRQKYPGATIVASTLNAVAEEMMAVAAQLPVITSEIGDTWIHGCGSSPVMMAQFRALLRLYADWMRTGRLDPESDLAVDFAIRLGLIAEHTWGGDVKMFLIDWDQADMDAFRATRSVPFHTAHDLWIQKLATFNKAYDMDGFNASRNSWGFLFLEESWREKASHIDRAIALLPENLQSEARTVVNAIGTVPAKSITTHDRAKEIDGNGAISIDRNGVKIRAGEIAYQTFSARDYDNFHKAYLRVPHWWAVADFGKPGLEDSNIQSAVLTARATHIATGKHGKDKRIDCRLAFPDSPAVDSSVFPEQINMQYIVKKDGSVDMTVSFVNKPAVRAPEAWWVSFVPSEVVSVFAEKMGGRVDVLDVVKGGNRQMHGIDSYVDIVTGKGTFRITSLDAPLVAVGERNALNYSVELPDLSRGIHFCLFNNLWGTNYAMWWGGSIDCRFRMEYMPG